MDVLLAAAGMYGTCFVLYMLYGWIKDFNRKSTPIEATPPKVVYSSQIIQFPDGVVTLTDKKINSLIPDITRWTPPMQELFLLIVKDWRNWEKFAKCRWVHTPTSNYIETSDVIEHETLNGVIFKYLTYKTNLSLYSIEVLQVTMLAKIWKEVHYGDKLRRINNIKNIRQQRVTNESRQKEAQQIRDYLKEKGL